MFKAEDIANYYILKDNEKKYFNLNVVEYNGRKSYEGNIRLNKYLFLSQVVYLARYDVKLFSDDFVAYDNGPVITEIVESFPRLVRNTSIVELPTEVKEFLDKIYFSLENASFEELIEITHEDPEWKRLNQNTYNAPVMNIEDNLEEYKKRYKGIIEALKL